MSQSKDESIHERETEPALPVEPSAVEKVLEEIVQVPEDNVVDLQTRQQRRAAERAAEKEQQQLVSITREGIDKLQRARIMLAALVRQQGRVRIPQRELQVPKGDRLDVKVQENGDLVVTYIAAR